MRVKIGPLTHRCDGVLREQICDTRKNAVRTMKKYTENVEMGM